MFARVCGPYTRKNGYKAIVIHRYDENGKFVKQEYIGYQKYLKDYDAGKHQYTPPPERNGILVHGECAFCGKEFNRVSTRPISKYCSVPCYREFKKKNKRIVLAYDKQIVVTIAGREPDEYYYVLYELKSGNKERLFIPTNKCKIVVSADDNSVKRFRIDYDRKDACRVRPVVGYKKHFWITETGVLVSKRTKKVLSNYITDRGYCYHATKIGGRKGTLKTFKIHRLVAMAFIPNPENKRDINHKNGIKTDNNLSNLEWMTIQENVAHAVRMNLMRPLYGENANGARFTNKQVESIRRFFRENPKSITISDFCTLMQISVSSCSNILSGKTYRQ